MRFKTLSKKILSFGIATLIGLSQNSISSSQNYSKDPCENMNYEREYRDLGGLFSHGGTIERYNGIRERVPFSAEELRSYCLNCFNAKYLAFLETGQYCFEEFEGIILNKEKLKEKLDKMKWIAFPLTSEQKKVAFTSDFLRQFYK